MNWKREAADKLRNYEAHREALDSIPKEIKRLELAYAGIRSAHHGRPPGFPAAGIPARTPCCPTSSTGTS